VSIQLQQQQPRQNQNQTSNRQPRHLSLWTRSWDCWRTWNLATYDSDSNEWWRYWQNVSHPPINYNPSKKQWNNTV